MNLKHVVVAYVIGVVITQCSSSSTEDGLRMNDVQVIGSHNSYKKAIDPVLMNVLVSKDSTKSGLDYYHLPIHEQLDLGLRGLEIDVLFDPQGGRYSRPAVIDMLKPQEIVINGPDSIGELTNPGFKVLHVPDIDFRTHCYTLRACLEEVKEWSMKHPDHLPIMITINPKESGVDQPGFTKVLPFSRAVVDSLNKEIISVFPLSELISPVMVKGESQTLRASIVENGWPALSKARGKVMFIFDAGGNATGLYQSLPLDERAMFVSVAESEDDAAFLIINDPVKDSTRITDLVKKGFMIRTRSDADTKEARLVDYRRFKAAVSSGAQLISTDYYLKTLSPAKNFEITLQGKYQQCNPVLKKENCTL